MGKKRIKIVDDTFKYLKSTMSYHESEFIQFDKVKTNDTNELLFITDFALKKVDNYNGVKVAMLVEPRAINPAIYEFIQKNHDKFHKVFTYDKELIETCDNVEFYAHCGCCINTEDHRVYEKTKLLSFIASNKMQTIGHRFRHSIMGVFEQNKIEVANFGRGYNTIDYKLEALKDFAFSLVIENSKIDYYFTEKLIDSFITGTVPIYWGCPSIGDFFNLDGMIIFNDIDDLLNKINTLSLDKYHSMLPAINDNFERAKKYLTSEDWLFQNSNIFN
jgi:hypothetical protein